VEWVGSVDSGGAAGQRGSEAHAVAAVPEEGR
jgi:hypothetical protein